MRSLVLAAFAAFAFGGLAASAAPADSVPTAKQQIRRNTLPPGPCKGARCKVVGLPPGPCKGAGCATVQKPGIIGPEKGQAGIIGPGKSAPVKKAHKKPVHAPPAPPPAG